MKNSLPVSSSSSLFRQQRPQPSHRLSHSAPRHLLERLALPERNRVGRARARFRPGGGPSVAAALATRALVGARLLAREGLDRVLGQGLGHWKGLRRQRAVRGSLSWSFAWRPAAAGGTDRGRFRSPSRTVLPRSRAQVLVIRRESGVILHAYSQFRHPVWLSWHGRGRANRLNKAKTAGISSKPLSSAYGSLAGDERLKKTAPARPPATLKSPIPETALA